MNFAASAVAGSASSKNVERTTPSALAPAFSIIEEFSQVSPAMILAVIPSSRACLMISGGAVAMEDGAKITSGFAALMLVKIDLKSVVLVWNCCSLTMLPPSSLKARRKKFPRPEE